ncbi:MAG TPA: hypothetical protein VGB18_09530 [Candidatus Thermoplasmatota archaeon]
MLRRVLFVLGTLLLPGCVELGLAPECPAPTGWVVAGPYHDGGVSAFGAASGYHRMLYHVRNPTNDSVHLGWSLEVPGKTGETWTGAKFASREDPVPPNGTFIGSATPTFDDEDASSAAATADGWEYQVRMSLTHDECKGFGDAGEGVRFAPRAAGEQAQPGVGVQVRTAGFWTNGTLFYTNMQRVHDDPRIEHAGWYAWEGNDPLPVYIYNTTRTERPERYNASGFVTTIPGFNEALKSIFVGTSFVADLAPEEAYTRPGNEGHDLYGDEIVFYIEITDVVAIDCPYPQPVCEAPTAPPASHAGGPPRSKPGPPV